jgi:putative tryptophan/tyrosine transport system substrate-binding protein
MVCAMLAVAAAPSCLAQGPRLPKIGYFLLEPMSERPSRERQAFLDGLRERGYVPGKNVDIVYRSAEGAADFLDDVAQDLVAQKPDVIVVSGAGSVPAITKATRSIPIVGQALGDPVGIGAVRSLSRPEGNITGVSFLSSELAGKRVQLVKDFLPRAKRVAVLWDMRQDNARIEAQRTLEAVARLGLEAIPYAVSSDAELRRAMAQMQTARPDALYVTFEGGMVASNRTAIAEFGVEHRIPVVSGYSFLTEAGGFMSYAPDLPALFRRSASYVDRILKGAKPADLPVELAATVELVINLKTAQALGISISHSLLVRADKVIE